MAEKRATTNCRLCGQETDGTVCNVCLSRTGTDDDTFYACRCDEAAGFVCGWCGIAADLGVG